MKLISAAKDVALAEIAEELFQQAIILAARSGGRAADVVEDLAVLHPVIRDAIDRAALIEINGDDLPVFLGWLHKAGLPHGAGDVIECAAVTERARGRRRAKAHANLLLAHARLNLHQVVLLKLSSVLGDLLGASGCEQRDTAARREQNCAGRPLFQDARSHHHIPLVRSPAWASHLESVEPMLPFD
jgi:hypothetical protein